MKTSAQHLAVFATFAALLGTALAPLSASDATEAFDASTVLRTPPPQEGDLLAFDMNRTIMQQTQLIRYQATEYQRKVAEERARAFVAAQRRAIAAAQTPATTKKAPKPSKEEPKPSKSVTKKSPALEPEKPQLVEQPKKLPRYIAVDTVKDKRASPKAKKVIMIWDTQSESLVGNNLYDVQNPPPVGSTSTFETYSAQYIGAGL